MTKILGNPIRILFAAATLLTTVPAIAATNPKQSAPTIPAFPGTLVNARFIYVTSYDVDQFNPDVLPEDRRAIMTVQDAMQKWGKFTLVYEPWKADIVLAVQSRPTEDVLVVYDAKQWPTGGPYLWRMMGRNGLQASEAPLVNNLEQAFDKIAKN
jgi:hypothetical protein